jgi:hypothetical protein
MMSHPEEVLKAAQSAKQLDSDLRGAHKAAIRENYLLEISLRGILEKAVEMELKLKELDAALSDQAKPAE